MAEKLWILYKDKDTWNTKLWKVRITTWVLGKKFESNLSWPYFLLCCQARDHSNIDLWLTCEWFTVNQCHTGRKLLSLLSQNKNMWALTPKFSVSFFDPFKQSLWHQSLGAMCLYRLFLGQRFQKEENLLCLKLCLGPSKWSTNICWLTIIQL